MQWRNSETRYGLFAQLLHWSIVVLIIVQFVLALRAERLPLGIAKIATLAQHKSFGMTILTLAVIRLLWRWRNPAPPLPSNSVGWQRTAAHLSHAVLYGLLLLLPVLGWLMSSAKNYAVSWFNVFTFPDLIAPNEAAFEFLRSAHTTLAWTLFVVAVVHALAALKHHFIDRDNVLLRMLPLKLREERQ